MRRPREPVSDVNPYRVLSPPQSRRALRTDRLGWALAACVVLAVASLAAPSVPNSDPWGWVIWGRELDHLDLVTAGYPSWKPLPAGVTALLGLLGAGPGGWLVVVRAGGLAVLVLAYRMAARHGGRVAGVVAAAGIALFPDWWRYLAHGTSEPLLIAFLLGGIEAHLAGRRRLAFACGLLAGLLRPEVWPFVLVYAVAFRPATVRQRVGVGLALLMLPVLWFGPDWISSGDPFNGAGLARHSAEALATQAAGSPVLEALRAGSALAVIPLEVLGLLGVLLAWRRRERPVLALAALALSWIALVLVLTAFGYAGIARFLEPAAALVCVLGGIGAAWIIASARRFGAGALIAGALLLAALAPSAIPRGRAAVTDVRDAAAQAAAQRDLRETIARLGGPRGVLARGYPFATPSWQTALAWELGVSTDQVGTLRLPAVVFRASLPPFPELDAWTQPGPGKFPLHVTPVLRHRGWDVVVLSAPPVLP